MKEFISKSLEETKEIAKNFTTSLEGHHQRKKGNGATVVGLYGELGSGKTTFMKYLAEHFGVKETIQSPTFVIEKIYSLSSNESRVTKYEKLIHIDAYRLEKEDEMINLGWREIISDPDNLICIEWPERIKGIMPEHFVIRFEHLSETERKIKFDN